VIAQQKMFAEAAVGDRIKFASEKQSYLVRARDDRFIIATKPLNIHRTYLYTIVDIFRMVRGPDNLIFERSGGYGDDQQCREAIFELNDPENVIEVSYRNCIDLDIERVIKARKPK
jgi:hypothetical protein